MPIVNIKVLNENVSVEQKSALIKGTTDLLQQVLNKDPAHIFVVIDEVSTDNWGFMGKSVTELKKG